MLEKMHKQSKVENVQLQSRKKCFVQSGIFFNWILLLNKKQKIIPE